MISDSGVEWDPCPDRAEVMRRLVELEKGGATLFGLVDAAVKGGQRVTDADALLALCGTTYAEFVGMGFRYEDLVHVIQAVYDAVGFTARRKASGSPTAGA